MNTETMTEPSNDKSINPSTTTTQKNKGNRTMQKHIQKMILVVAAAMFAAAPLFTVDARPMRSSNGPKYVFFFLGDGMANVQMQAAEAYLAHVNGGSADNSDDMLNPDNILNMNKFPYQGMNTTFAKNRFVTGSAASGTAFACGAKTSIRTIGRAEKGDPDLLSVAELAQDQGRAIGILSSVSLPHATPAAYYANVDDRGEYLEIGYQGAQSGFDFFGGGKFRKLDQDPGNGITLQEEFTAAGYHMVDSIDDALAVPAGEKVVCSVPTSPGGDAMPYAIDRPEENFSLSEVTDAAIQRLQNDPEGFFIMVEAGKIDWACHANDAVGAIGDTLEFDAAIGKAIDFYNNHPNETLIVVTGDHECGGMVLGFVGKDYDTAFEVLLEQENSYEHFSQNEWADYKDNTPYVDAATSNIDGALQALIEENFGLVWAELSDYQKQLLEDAYDTSRGGLENNTPTGYMDEAGNNNTVDHLSYATYDPFVIALTHLLNRKAGIDWTSTSHTGVPVPVLAAGFDGWRFNGFYDNTDIAKKLAKAMRIRETLPVEE